MVSDNGTFLGQRPAFMSLLSDINFKGPVGLIVNYSKCEIFWPTGDRACPEFPPEIKRYMSVNRGADFWMSSLLFS